MAVVHLGMYSEYCPIGGEGGRGGITALGISEDNDEDEVFLRAPVRDPSSFASCAIPTVNERGASMPPLVSTGEAVVPLQCSNNNYR